VTEIELQPNIMNRKEASPEKVMETSLATPKRIKEGPFL
jgi:hypothetical protein